MPDPEPVIEILSYVPLDMTQFLQFAVEGKPDGLGDFETDEQGQRITGIFRWLHGREVPEAHFFHSAAGDPLQLFVATIQRLETYNVPWLRRIPGFQAMVNTDGLIGKTNTFAPLSDLMASVQPDPALDERFAQGNADIQRVVAELQSPRAKLTVGRKGLLATLRGDIGTDPLELFAEVREKFKITL